MASRVVRGSGVLSILTRSRLPVVVPRQTALRLCSRLHSNSCSLLRWRTASTIQSTAAASRHYNTTTTPFTQVSTDDNVPTESKKKEKFASLEGVRGDGKTLRWYKDVTVVPFDPIEGAWTVALDSRSIRTSRSNRLWCPNKPIATLIAAEWARQDGNIRPFSMPLMQVASTAIDLVPEDRTIMIGNSLNHLDTDTILFRAPPSEDADDLRELQGSLHGPLIEWFQNRYNCKLHINKEESIMLENQTTLANSVVRWTVHNYDDWRMACVSSIVQSSKSLIIAMALERGLITGIEALRSARVEENYQSDRWGKVEAGHDLDEKDYEIRFLAAATILRLLELPSSKLVDDMDPGF
eukprot:TRINITY_DN14795_c0_g1_i1.p1 TRINITY_DN14795_c0_g1~~TRINITY_DN14795_c0_g1_i1.p1  ORF type:complete len:353 (+),score=39.43 TRINITY_DN14795_c0_g1_i1:170-1228(+)